MGPEPDKAFDNLIPDLLYFVNRKCLPSWHIEKHRIDFHDLTYVYSGSVTYLVNGTEYNLEQGSFIYIPKGSLRQAYTSASAPMHCYAVNFNIGGPGMEHERLPFPTIFESGMSKELSGLYKDLNRTWVEKNPGYQMKARAIFMLILHKLIYQANCTGNPVCSDSRIAKVKEYILANYHRKIEIKDLAEIAGLHPVYLGALFNKINHCTIKQYIHRIRVNNAENLLSTGGYTVSEAAGRCGFEDIFYFSKVFKKYKGYPPSETLHSKHDLSV